MLGKLQFFLKQQYLKFKLVFMELG